jgi:hypothetical protein
MIITELDPSGFEIGGDIYFQLRKNAEASIGHMGAELLDNTLRNDIFWRFSRADTGAKKPSYKCLSMVRIDDWIILHSNFYGQSIIIIHPISLCPPTLDIPINHRLAHIPSHVGWYK